MYCMHGVAGGGLNDVQERSRARATSAHRAGAGEAFVLSQHAPNADGQVLASYLIHPIDLMSYILH